MEPVILGTCIWLYSEGAVVLSPQYPDPRDCGTEPGGPVWLKAEQTVTLRDVIHHRRGGEDRVLVRDGDNRWSVRPLRRVAVR